MKKVIIESPLSGDFAMHRYYAKLAMRDCIAKGEAPYASHLLYDQVDLLDDRIIEEREQGMEAGFEWGTSADVVAVYEDLGISDGMKRGIGKADQRGLPVAYRRIEGWEEIWKVNEGRVRRGYYHERHIGRLPVEFKTYTIIALPDGRLDTAGSVFALWELRGLLETCASRIEALSTQIQGQYGEDDGTREEVPEGRLN